MASAAKGTIDISLKDVTSDVNGILTENEGDIYPNLHAFVTELGKSCRAAFDTVTFSEVDLPKATLDAHVNVPLDGSAVSQVQPLKPAGGAARTAELIIIEDIDERQIRRLLSSHVALDDRRSFLSFLDDYLDNHPTYNFNDAQDHIAPAPSTLAAQQHVAFKYWRLREFEEVFDLTYEAIRTSPSDGDGGVWRNKHIFGPMNPVPRVDANGKVTSFPPLAVMRAHVAAWFDAEPDKPWSLGVILVDRAATFSHLPQRIRSPYFNIAGRRYRGIESTRTLLSRCMGANPSLNRPGIPAPLVALQDVYRLLAFEYSHIDSFFTRDLNYIEWLLQGGRGGNAADDTTDHAPETYKKALRSLFFIRRRLSRFLQFLCEPLASCRASGRPSWRPAAHGGPAGTTRTIADRVAEELAADLAHVEALLGQSFNRLEQCIRHIVGETTLREAERTGQQNRLLLVLAVAGTFFLPVSAVAAVFSMTGDWAPAQANFPLFWAVCISITAVLIVMLVAIVRWSAITRFIRAVRRRGQGGYEAIV